MHVNTKLTKSGIFIREENDFGLLVYSPFSGHFFAVHSTESQEVAQWLDGQRSLPPTDSYQSILGNRNSIQLRKNVLNSHLLPNEEIWSFIPTVEQPLLINWLITGRCPLACKYCYAEDLMRNDANEPTIDDIDEIADAIIALNPLAVVLTGGDPLFSPLLEDAMRLLSGKVGIIIDTSGYPLKPKHLALFKQYQAVVRISLDSERPKKNQFHRPIHSQYTELIKKGVPTANAALDAIVSCLDIGIPVTVQTVATKWNVNDLLGFGDKLYRLGVRSWRIFQVVDSEINHKHYVDLIGKSSLKDRTLSKPYDYIFSKLLETNENSWNMTIQVTDNNSPNAVILVSPNGTFYTESNIHLGKETIDKTNPHHPTLEEIHRKVDMQAHVNRYINRTGPRINKKGVGK